MTDRPDLDAARAADLAQLALDNVEREFPNKLDHVLAGPSDARTPRALHPVFFGSFDWHSCVHMHWLLARVAARFPALPVRAAIDAHFARRFTAEAIGGELAYLAGPYTRSFERTYGWAWLLKLAAELAAGDATLRRHGAALAPLAAAFSSRYVEYLPRAQFPWRYGMHANSAFGLGFALDYAAVAGDATLDAAARAAARTWFAADRDAPAAYEPSGADFLSPALVEALLMARVLDAGAFPAWLDAFLPGFAGAMPVGLFAPVAVSDRADPQIVHLDGLNLSRAWCFRGIAAALPAGDPRGAVARAAARRHLDAGLEGLASADYMGAHWLGSFALLAWTETAADARPADRRDDRSGAADRIE